MLIVLAILVLIVLLVSYVDVNVKEGMAALMLPFASRHSRRDKTPAS